MNTEPMTLTEGYRYQLEVVSQSVTDSLNHLIGILPQKEFEELKSKLKPLHLPNGLPGSFHSHISNILRTGLYIGFQFSHPLDSSDERVMLTRLPLETKLAILEEIEKII